MFVGGVILLISGLMLVFNLAMTHASGSETSEMTYAEPIHPAPRVPALLNGFGFWNIVILIYLVASYGYPVAQFFLIETHGVIPWSI
jgi:cytochrome c oxidase subunit 1